MALRLIINADDFGLTPGINRAIQDLHRARALTSTTLMATGAAFEDAIAIARASPTLGVGCHIALVDGIPVSHPSEIPTLLGADGKTFRPSLLDFSQALLRRSIHPDEILRETLSQIEKLQRSGIEVTHLDTHKHTHLFPAVTQALLQAAQRCGVGAIRNPFEPSWSLALHHGTRLRRTTIHLLNRAFGPGFQAKLKRSHPQVATTDGTLAISTTGDLNLRTLAQLLKSLPEAGTFELVCHPGYADAALEALPTRLRASRETEFQALLQRIPPLFENPGGPELIHYGYLGPFARLGETGQPTLPTGNERVL
jgi:predicted glycoside hydrolase/deacetylase ChbG (UPF0249 family)